MSRMKRRSGVMSEIERRPIVMSEMKKRPEETSSDKESKRKRKDVYLIMSEKANKVLV